MPDVTKRLRPLFVVCDEMTKAADHAVYLEGPGEIGTLEHFDRVVFMRALNTLKAARGLLALGHWEIASVCARQLFELVLNMEAIADGDRAERQLTFAKYGLLQRLMVERREIQYCIDTGRPYDHERFKGIDAYLASTSFVEFQTQKPGKEVQWARSWNGKTVYEMATASTDPLRIHHYNNLFRKWSEEAHAAPGALLESLFRVGDGEWVERLIHDEDRNTSEVLVLSMNLLLELWLNLPAAPKHHLDRSGQWLDRVNDFVRRDMDETTEEYTYPRNPDGSYLIPPLADADEPRAN
jgi:Family of unknown function (DUF5677)